MEYRGIQLHADVKLFTKKGDYNLQVIRGLDKLADYAEKHNHKIVGVYKGYSKEMLIDFNCGHKPIPKRPLAYTVGNGCPMCARRSPELAEKELKEKIQENGHTLLSKYEGALKPVKIDFNCGCEPSEVIASDYKLSKNYQCQKCQNKKSSIVSRDKFYKTIEKLGWKLIGEYKNSQEPIEVICDKGHRRTTNPHNVNRSASCRECYLERMREGLTKGKTFKKKKKD